CPPPAGSARGGRRLGRTVSPLKAATASAARDRNLNVSPDRAAFDKTVEGESPPAGICRQARRDRDVAGMQRAAAIDQCPVKTHLDTGDALKQAGVAVDVSACGFLIRHHFLF